MTTGPSVACHDAREAIAHNGVRLEIARDLDGACDLLSRRFRLIRLWLSRDLRDQPVCWHGPLHDARWTAGPAPRHWSGNPILPSMLCYPTAASTVGSITATGPRGRPARATPAGHDFDAADDTEQTVGENQRPAVRGPVDDLGPALVVGHIGPARGRGDAVEGQLDLGGTVTSAVAVRALGSRAFVGPSGGTRPKAIASGSGARATERTRLRDIRRAVGRAGRRRVQPAGHATPASLRRERSARRAAIAPPTPSPAGTGI
jgi:hypothetical protein